MSYIFCLGNGRINDNPLDQSVNRPTGISNHSVVQGSIMDVTKSSGQNGPNASSNSNNWTPLSNYPSQTSYASPHPPCGNPPVYQEAI